MSLLPDGHQSGMFIHAPVDQVADCLVKWGNEELVNRFTRAERRTMSLKEAWPFVDETRHWSPNRAFVIGMKCGWTAFFDNHSRQFGAASEQFVPCLRLRTDTCFFSYDHASNTVHQGSVHFSYFRFIGGDPPVQERSVMLLNESGWRFNIYGDPLPFEDLAAYTAQKKKDRLTVDRMKEYGRAIGLPFWDPDAYGTTVFLLRWGDGPRLDDKTVLKRIISVFGRPSVIFRPRRQNSEGAE